MSISDGLLYLVAGIAIGSVSAMAGAVFSYMRYMSSGDLNKTGGPMGTMLVMNGTLLVVGAIGLFAGAIAGELVAALVTGLGVFIGFSIVFGVMLYLWTSIED